MKICFDLDGVLCELKSADQSYSDVKPKPYAVERLKQLKEAGHYIVIATARHMKTCDHNIGKVVARQGKVTLDWLEKHGFVYDEIWFGKPHCDIYIDDNGYRLTEVKEILPDGSNLPLSHEKSMEK